MSGTTTTWNYPAIQLHSYGIFEASTLGHQHQHPPINPSYIIGFINHGRSIGVGSGNGSSSSYDVTDNKTNDLYFKTPFITMNDIFHREDERLKTFENWPISWLDKKQLAQTGMFYTGDDDKVKCYFCEVEIGRWERDDLPVPEHLRWSPNCPLLRRRTTNNVPIDNEELNQILPPISYDICGANDAIEVRPPTTVAATSSQQPSNEQQTTPNTATTATSPRALVNATTYYPEYPEYAIEAARVRSFSEWPRHMKQSPTQMAEAGFFHSGIGDRVKCFSCGGGLKDWDDSDEPWEQHALWLPKCRFLKLMKGENFIEAVIAKHKQQQQPNADFPMQQNGEKEKPSCSSLATQQQFDQQQQQQQVTVMSAMLDVTAASTPAATATATMSTSTQAENASTTIEQFNNSNEATTMHCDQLNVAEKSSTLPTTATTAASTCNSNSNSSSNIPEEKLCKICYANEYNTAFLPCGHVVACAKCASSVTKCPMCRKPFTDVMRVYFS